MAENPDLFWAIRGAGANVGVVTRFTFRLHPVGPDVYGGLIAWPFERAASHAAYRDLTAGAPRELTAWLVLLLRRRPRRSSRRRGTAADLRHGVCYSGDPAGAEEVLAPIRALGDPVVDLLQMPYTQVQSYLDDGGAQGHALLLEHRVRSPS